MSNGTQQFLVIQTAFIGDVVLATGILEKLHARFPDAAIDFMVRKCNEGLLANHPFLREVLVWDKGAGKYRELMRLMKLVRARRYDKVINVQRFAATGLLTIASGAKEKIGFDKNPLSAGFTRRIKHRISTAENPLHEIERNNALIAGFTDSEVFKPKLYPSTADYSKVAGFKSKPFICVAPSSVWFTKQYPEGKWVDFLRQLPPGYSVFLLGAPSDKELCDRIAVAAGRQKLINLAGQLNLLQSAALMKDAVMNYVNDSAPMHFASAMNAPVTAVYCSTLPSFGFGPVSDNSYVVETTEALPCRPCGLHGRKACPLTHFNCAHTIMDAQLLSTIPVP